MHISRAYSKQRIVSCSSPLTWLPVSYRYAPPLLGEHTDEILKAELNLNEDQIKSLKDSKII